MCRNIRQLFNFEPPATHEEIRAASTQFVSKVSGMQKPSMVNQAPFEKAVEDVSAVLARLFDDLQTSAPTRDREVEAARAMARSRERFGR